MYTRTMKPILSYAGAKSRVADYLVACFPKHTLFVDLFCGMLSVTLAKPRTVSKTEWINDKYHDVVNFFEVIKTMPDEFIQAFRDEYVFDSEYLYKYWVQRLRDGECNIPDLQRAVMFWMTQRQTFSGRNVLASTSYSFSACLIQSGRHPLDLPVKEIHALHDRLNGVQIFSRDFNHIFDMLSKRSDNRSTFIFEDPPYWDTAGMYDYAEKMTLDQHKELARRNLESGCNWMLTINNHPDIQPLYEGKEGVYIRSYKIMYTTNPSQGPRENQELMISNFDTTQQFGPLFNLGG